MAWFLVFTSGYRKHVLSMFNVILGLFKLILKLFGVCVFVFSFYDTGFILRTQKLSVCIELGYRYHISPCHFFALVVKAQNSTIG